MNTRHLTFISHIFACIFIGFSCLAQEITGSGDTACIQKDAIDLLRASFGMKPKPESEKSGSALLIPVIGTNPATGFMVGIGGQYAFKLPGANTRYSLLSGGVQFTTKNQQLFLIKNSIYTKNNNVFFTGDWRYLVFSQSTYGLGTNAPHGSLAYQYNLGGLETSTDSLAQPIKFNFLRLYQSASFRIGKGMYVGLGYYLDHYFKIQDEKLRLTPGDSIITSHYSYSLNYGFDPVKYYSSALNINVILDTRDNIINPYKGHFLMISWNGSVKLLGNKNTASSFSLEWRSFHPVSTRNPRHLVAFWLMGNFLPEGDFPYMILPATAYDQRSRSARGYTQGRFRGNHLVYGEAEYRFPLSPCGGVWGGVLFVNATTANNPKQGLALFDSVKPAYGIGLRVMVDKKTRTNLALDVGFGDKSSGFYLVAAETF
jgi:outer membrane protein assembly factor BamA